MAAGHQSCSLGLALAGVGFAQVYTGFDLLDPGAPKSVVVIWGIIVGVVSTALVFAIVKAFYIRIRRRAGM